MRPSTLRRLVPPRPAPPVVRAPAAGRGATFTVRNEGLIEMNTSDGQRIWMSEATFDTIRRNGPAYLERIRNEAAKP